VIGDLVACFGCGGRFTLEQLKEVGDAVFCRTCLGRMLRRVDDRSASALGPNGAHGAGGPTRDAGPRGVRGPGGVNRTAGVTGAAADRAPIARTSAADPPCFLCGEPLQGGAFVELRGFAICARCSRGLLAEDPAAGEGARPGDGRSVADGAVLGDDVSVEADAAGDEGAARGAPRRTASAAVPPQVIETPGSGTEWCSRCGRAMPGPGSYVLVDGRPHCAACAQRSTSASPKPTPEDPPAALATGSACDACDRALGAGPQPETHGFRLCGACRSSDPELAVALARARHQRRLACASRRILDGDDDRDDDRDDDGGDDR
jgi:hypothetical protein